MFGGLFQKINVPRLVDEIISILPSLSRSTASTSEPTPERLCTSSGINSAPPGAFEFRTIRYQYNTGGPNGSGSRYPSICEKYHLPTTKSVIPSPSISAKVDPWSSEKVTSPAFLV